MDHLLRNDPESIRRVALKFYRESNFGNALGYFLVVASLKNEWKETLLHYVVSCLDAVCLQLESVGKHQELLRLYKSTMEVYPSVGQLHRMLGECLYRQGHLAEAGGYLRCALSDSTSALYNRSAEAATQDTLDRISCRLVDRWHFTMLNDRGRNIAFRRAIAAAVSDLRPDDVVLDVGAGTAILSMMAVAAGAGSVYACDSSAVMCDVAAAVLADNCMSDKVHLVNKHSSDLRPGVDIPKRVSLLVSETVDCGLFGEDILNTVSDAWRHLLDPGRGRVLPCRAAVHACLVQSDYVRAQFTSYDSDGGDAWWRLSEPYWTEQLATVPGGYTTLTRDVTVLAVDFNDPLDVERCLAGGKNGVCELVASCEGRVDAVIAWFELWLSDDVALSTAPDPQCCWEQAVFPVYSTTVCLVPEQAVSLKVRCGDHLHLELQSGDGRVDPVAVPVDAEAVSYLNDLEYASWQLQQLSGWQPPALRSAAVLDLTPHGRSLDRLAGADVTVLDRGGSWSDMLDVVRSRCWDLVVHYPCLSSGLLDPALLQLLPQCRLADGCRVLPRHLVVWGVIVKSQLIVDMTSLDRVNTLGFDCSALDMYQVDMVQDMVVSPRTCQHVSPVCELAQLDLFSGEFATEHRFQLPVEPPGVAADALLFWLLPPGVSGVPARHRRHTALRCRSACESGAVSGTVQLMAHGLHITIADSG